MDDSLRDAMVYLCKHYPHPDELSKGRLTKLVYLADWRSAIERGVQLTDIKWIFNHYGPYVHDIVDLARENQAFTVDLTQNAFGSSKEVIRASADAGYPTLTDEDKRVLDFVIDSTKTKYWGDFINLVYSTYPVVTQDRYSELDLVELAEEYKDVTALLDSKS